MTFLIIFFDDSEFLVRLVPQIPQENYRINCRRNHRTKLDMSDNVFSGTFAKEIGLLTDLSILRLNQNNFEGSLDVVFCDGRVFDEFSSDCNADSPEIKCTCCTRCF